MDKAVLVTGDGEAVPLHGRFVVLRDLGDDEGFDLELFVDGKREAPITYFANSQLVAALKQATRFLRRVEQEHP